MPQLVHEMRVNGGWVGVPDVREETPVTITRGRRDQGTGVDRGKCAMLLNNRHGRYSEDNPLSPYYGSLGRNTLWNTYVRGDLPFLRILGNGVGDRVTTPADPALDITGDLDVVVDFAPLFFPELRAGQIPGFGVLIGRYNASAGVRNWRLVMAPDGRLMLAWSTTGTDFHEKYSTAAATLAPGIRGAVRATLDVDNGSGGNTVTFYQAESAAGPWTQLGDPVVTSGTTSVYNGGSNALDIGDVTGSGLIGLRGRVYSAEVRNGIDGPAIASPDFTSLTPGTTTFTDSAGRDWTLEGPNPVVSQYYRRFFGAVPAWPQSWDQSGNDCWTSIEVAGPLRRLDKGRRPVQSTLRKRIPLGNPLAYWPLEDGGRVDQPTNVIPGGGVLETAGLQFAQDDTLPGSDPLPTLASAGKIDASVLGASAVGWHVEMVYKLDALPSGTTTMLRADFDGGGDGIAAARLRINEAEIRLQLLDENGAEKYSAIMSSEPAREAFTGVWNRLTLFSASSGGQAYMVAGWRDIITGTWWYLYRTYTGSIGTISRVRASWSSGLQGMSVGHLSVFDIPGTVSGGSPSPGVSIYAEADDGFNGESAIARIRRIAEEEHMDIVAPGISATSTRMGPQPRGTVMDVIRDCEATDGGVMTEFLDDLALIYRPRTSLYNRPPVLVLDQAAKQIAAPLDPIKDDENIVNVLTVTRENGGSSSPVSLPPSHPLSEDNIGLYDKDEAYNLWDDDQTEDQAAWRLSLATVNDARVPTVSLNMLAPGMAPLRQRVLDYLDQQSVIEIRNTLFRPDPVRLVVEGYTERLSKTEWTFELNCSPAESWEVGTVETAKLDSAGSELGMAVDASDSMLVVSNPGDRPWTDDPSEAPWDIRVGGERMTVNAVNGSGVADTFTRAVSDGWGTADTGESWSVTGGLATDFAVAGGAGQHRVYTLNENRYSLMDQPGADFDIVAITGTSVSTVTGAAVQSYLVARFVDVSNYYAARVEWDTSGSVHLTVTRIVGGTPFAHPSVQVASGVSAATAVSVRFQGVSTHLRARAWLTADPEPETWLVSVDEPDLSGPGLCGTRSRALTGNTNSLPISVAWDNFTIAQTMSVQRSVNGIVKSHSAGAPIVLADPAIVAY